DARQRRFASTVSSYCGLCAWTPIASQEANPLVAQAASLKTLILFGEMEVGAGDGNRTHVASLEGWSSTIELHPQRMEYYPAQSCCQWRREVPSTKIQHSKKIQDPSSKIH